jgi:hypothetical protein
MPQLNVCNVMKYKLTISQFRFFFVHNFNYYKRHCLKVVKIRTVSMLLLFKTLKLFKENYAITNHVSLPPPLLA